MGSFRPAAGNPCLHGSHNFAESLVETALSSLRHSCRSELHAFPVARGVDYTFISMTTSCHCEGRSPEAISFQEEIASLTLAMTLSVEIPACCGAYRFGVATRRHRLGICHPEVVTGLTVGFYRSFPRCYPDPFESFGFHRYEPALLAGSLPRGARCPYPTRNFATLGLL